MKYLDKSKFALALKDINNIFLRYTTGRGDYYHSLLDDSRYVIRHILNDAKPSYKSLTIVRDKVKLIGRHFHKNGNPFPIKIE